MKQVHFLVFALFAAMTLAFGLVVAQQQANEQAIEDVVRQYVERFNAGDAAGIAELYTEDGTHRDPFGGVHEGRDAIEQAYQGAMDAGVTDMSAEVIEAHVLNDTAYQIGSHSSIDPEGEPLEGYFMTIFTRENDEWRVHRQIANMAMPEPEMEVQDEPAPAPRGAFVQPTELVLRTAAETFEVPDASEVVVDIFTAEEETTIPWHTHPGPVLIVVNSGEFTYQHTDCSVDVYGPGEVAIDPGDGYVHRAHVTAGTELGLVFFGVPAGEEPADYDVEAPDCPDPTS